MPEELDILPYATRRMQYENLYPQLKALLTGETDVIAGLANVSAALKEVFGFLWVGFYIVKKNQLVLGPFQGSIACTRISYGKGVCGTAWKEKRVVLVPDVHNFEGHISCNSLSCSELVMPIFRNNEVVAVLDIDSEFFNYFNETDVTYLQQIIDMLDACQF